MDPAAREFPASPVVPSRARGQGSALQPGEAMGLSDSKPVLGEVSLERMVRAVEKVSTRLLRAATALEQAKVPYARSWEGMPWRPGLARGRIRGPEYSGRRYPPASRRPLNREECPRSGGIRVSPCQGRGHVPGRPGSEGEGCRARGFLRRKGTPRVPPAGPLRRRGCRADTRVSPAESRAAGRHEADFGSAARTRFTCSISPRLVSLTRPG